jgi:hypothetical protein
MLQLQQSKPASHPRISLSGSRDDSGSFAMHLKFKMNSSKKTHFDMKVESLVVSVWRQSRAQKKEIISQKL